MKTHFCTFCDIKPLAPMVQHFLANFQGGGGGGGGSVKSLAPVASPPPLQVGEATKSS